MEPSQVVFLTKQSSGKSCTLSVVSDKLDGMIVRATSPDGGVTLLVTGAGDVIIEFSPGWYRQYYGPDLERQLARSARLGWAGYQRGHKAVIDSVAGQELLNDDHDGPHRRVDELKRQVVVTASSANGSVWVRSVGLADWQFHVPTHPARTMKERELATALGSVLRDIVVDYRRKIAPAHADLFDLDLPPGMLDQLRRGAARPA